MPKPTRGKMIPKPAVILTLPVDPQLKELIGRAADVEGIPMNEWVARLAANALHRPELGEVPRKPLGRPRKELSLNGHHRKLRRPPAVAAG